MSAANPPSAAKSLTRSPQEFLAGCREDVKRAQATMAQFKSARDTSVRGIDLYDSAVAALSDAASRASICRNAHPDEAMRNAAEQCEQEIDAVATEFSLDRGVYEALVAIERGEEFKKVDAPTKHYVGKTLRELRRSGVDRDEQTRNRVRTLREELVKVGQEFGKNIIEDVRSVEVDPADLDGLPDDYRRAHAPGENGKVTITTDNTDYIPFVTYSKSGKAREALWRAYRLRAHPQNLTVLSSLLAKRHELATLLGYGSWADYATEDKMIGSAKNAREFITKISAASETRSARDYQQLLARKRKDDPQANEVAGWDSAYYQARVMAEEYGFDAQTVRPYYEYARVKDGVLEVTAEIFGVAYRAVKDADVWHAEVEVYDVLDDTGSNEVLGRIYLDMHPRPGKYKHYAQFTLVSGARPQSGSARLPEGALICNFPKSTPDAPGLLEHDNVKTFFHEFGHLLHHVLGGHTRHYGISGVATEWDFVEAPSQMLEEWVWDVPTLQRFGRHHKTGEAIPEKLISEARRADEYGKGLWVRQQMFYAATSLEFHGRDPRGLDTTKLMSELQSRYTPFRHVDGTYFHESFGHLDGYSAIYYTYMWSLVIAKDLFSVFSDKGMYNREVANRYRKEILEPGGGRPAAELVSAFLGRPFDFGSYQTWLSR